MEEITKEELVERQYRYLQRKNSQLEDKYKKLLHHSRSWCSKYQHIVQKTKQELKEQFTDEALGEAIKETKRKLERKYRYLEFELEEKYHKMQEDYKDRIIDSLKKNLQEEFDRWCEKDNSNSERSIGYMIAIKKLIKMLSEQK